MLGSQGGMDLRFHKCVIARPDPVVCADMQRLAGLDVTHDGGAEIGPHRNGHGLVDAKRQRLSHRRGNFEGIELVQTSQACAKCRI